MVKYTLNIYLRVLYYLLLNSDINNSISTCLFFKINFILYNIMFDIKMNE